MGGLQVMKIIQKPETRNQRPLFGNQRLYYPDSFIIDGGKMMKSIKTIFMVIMLSLCWVYGSQAATYYMRADGTAPNKEAATGPPSDKSKCMSVAVHNGAKFSPGDIIKISEQGGSIISQIIPPSSGSEAGGCITYAAANGESPLIDAGRRITSWDGTGTPGVYYSDPVDSYVNHVYEDGLPLKIASNSTCSDGNWYYNSSEFRKAYYKPTSGMPSDHIVSYAKNQIRGLIDLTNRSYIIISGLTIRNGEYCIINSNPSVNTSYLTIRNCVFNYSICGIYMSMGGKITNSNLTLENNYYYRCQAANHLYGTSNDNYIIRNNIVEDGGTIDGIDRWARNGAWQDEEAFGLQNPVNCLIESNIVKGGFQKAIFLYANDGYTASNNTICNNFIYNTIARAIQMEGDGNYALDNNRVYSNVIINTGKKGALGGSYGFYLRQGLNSSEMNYIENNVIFGCDDTYPIYLGFISGSNHYWTIRNNIIANYGSVAAIGIASYTNQLILDYNCWDTDGLFWLPSGQKTLAQMQALGFEKHSMVANPQFINAGGSKATDYRLQTISPCIGKGCPVGLITDFQGNKWRNPPSIGAIEYYKTGGVISPRTVGGSNYKQK